jgi:SAM-dependent methyltransferase
MPWFFAVAEGDHAIQNPTNPEKVRRLGEHLRLSPHSRVLDLGCGRGGPALILAETFGCRIVAVERAAEFAPVVRERIAAARLDSLIRVVEADARDFEYEVGAFDAALCLGASFIWDGLEGTLAAIAPAVRHRGHVVVGEPFWNEWPLPSAVDDLGLTSLAGVTDTFNAAKLPVVGLIASSKDDWDVYESQHWRSLEEWLEANPNDPDTRGFRQRHQDARNTYLRTERELLAWAMVIGWKRDL